MSSAPTRVSLATALEHQIRPLVLTNEKTLPVPDAFSGLFPGGLPRGVTLTLSGGAARTSAFALVATAMQAGSFLVVVGLVGLGWRAAAELGVPPERVVVVTEAGTDRDADTVAAALDGFDLVLTGPSLRLGATTERRLAARARERGTVLLAVHETTPDTPMARGTRTRDAFAGIAELRVTTRPEPWGGLEHGHGILTRRPVTIEAEGKRLPGRHRRDRLWLPDSDGQPRRVVSPATVLDHPVGTTRVAATAPQPRRSA